MNVPVGSALPPEPKPARLPLRFWLAWISTLVALCLTYIGGVYWLVTHHFNIGWALLASAVFGVVGLWLSWEPRRQMKRLDPQNWSLRPAGKRFLRRHLTAMGVYILCLFAAVSGFHVWRPEGVLAYALAIAPAIPLVADIAALGLYLREETDEFQKRMMVEAMLWATGGALCVATVWGFLEMFHLAPHVAGWAAFPLWCVFYGLATAAVRRRYRE